jgi:hypothetical protein
MNSLNQGCIERILFQARRKRQMKGTDMPKRHVPVCPGLREIFERNFIRNPVISSNLTRLARPE